MTAPRPLGFWVRTVDRLLDEQFERTAAETGLGRAEWQILNRLRIGAIADDARVDALAPYSEGEGNVDEALDRLAGAGLVEHQGNEYRLTDAGTARVDEVQDGAEQRIRDQAGDGVGADDFEHLVATLERVARNLGWEPI